MARVKFYKMEMISFKTLIECPYMLDRKRPARGNKDGLLPHTLQLSSQPAVQRPHHS